MKKSLFISAALLVMLFASFMTAFAQIGDTDTSSFTVQNLDDTYTATVTLVFINDGGTQYVPADLGGGQTNPFELAPGGSYELYVPNVPSSDLPAGRYSVVVSSDRQVAAVVNIAGSGSVNFAGSYGGLEQGATTFYLPSAYHSFYGWNSLISAQNVGSSTTDIYVKITCGNIAATGYLTATNVAPLASAHFDLETTVPDGFTGATNCSGSTVVTSSGEPVVAVDNQTISSSGAHISYAGSASGATELYVSTLYDGYYGWVSSLNISQLGSGTSEITVTYADATTVNCTLTNATPGCLLLIFGADYTGTDNRTSAKIESDNLPILAVANAANGADSIGVNAVDGSTTTSVALAPSVMNNYYGWVSSFTCQNTGTVDTTVNLSYEGYEGSAYDSASIAPGESFEVYQPSEGFLPAGYRGSLTATANAGSAQIACVTNLGSSGTGDYALGVSATNK